MPMRTILNCCIAVAGFTLAQPIRCQETAGKQLAGVVAVAISEYKLGIDTSGRIVAAVEVEEARSFFKYAIEVAQRLTGDNAVRVRSLVDSLATAVNAGTNSRDVAAMHDRFVVALGADAVL